MRRALVSLLLAACCFAVVSAVLAAEPAKPPAVQTHIKRVALFKNGLGFFVREGTLTGDEGNVLLGPFAAPTHGTFWVSCPTTTGLKGVISREVTVTEKSPCRNTQELLQANVGKLVQLGMPWENNGYVGTILSFGPAPDRPEPAPSPYRMGPPPPGDGNPYGQPQYMVFKSATGAVVILNPQEFGRIGFPNGDQVTTIEREVRGVELDASFASPKKGDWLSVSYLAKGITWAPSYLLDISDAKKARLTAAAVIVNEAEDLDGVGVDLVTGYPNLILADVVSPMARKESLAGFLNALSGGRSGGERGDAYAFMTQTAGPFASNMSVSYAGRGGGGGGAEPSYGAAAPGQAAEDLFLYPLEKVQLAKGETGQYPLFTEAVPYSEIYQWEIPDYITTEEQYQRSGAEATEIVWHNLRLTDTMKMPWTTAPAQLMKDGQMIGQTKLSYTAAGDQTTVQINRALNVRAEQTEREVSREPEAVKRYNNVFYDRVTLEGKLVVTNFQDKAVPLEIKKTLSGEVQQTSLPAKDIALARGIQRNNPVHELTWTLDLQPGETKEITYTFTALIRR